MPPTDNRRKKWYDFLGFIPKKAAKWLIILSLFPLAIAVALCTYAWRASNYDIKAVLAPLQDSSVFDRNGVMIGTLTENERINVTSKELPQNLVNAFIAREDEDFYRHKGIVYTSMARSVLRNITSMSFLQGGSTITMQLARNTYELRDKSIDRKLLEIAIARRIESHYDKDTILTSYLNRIYFGEQCYGVAQASARYFNKPVGELTLAESAMLAGLVRGPSIFNPVRSPEAANKVKNETLNRMKECGYITDEEAAAAENETVALASSEDEVSLSYPVLWIDEEMETYGESGKADVSSFYVLSTIDLEIQRTLELTTEPLIVKLENEPFWKGLPKRKDSKAEGCLQIAVLCVEPLNGSLRAVTGGRSPVDGMNRWDLKRQPGALFQPIVNITAAKLGHSIIRDNVIKTGESAGYANVMESAVLAGFTSDLPRSNLLYEGKFDATLRQIAESLIIVLNKGKKTPLHAVKQIVSSQNHLIYNNTLKTSGGNEVFGRENVFAVLKLQPFKPKLISKPASLDVELPDYRGRFHAKIGTNCAVFLWVGFDDRHEDYWAAKGVNAGIKALGNNIAEGMYEKITAIFAARKQKADEPAEPASAERLPLSNPQLKTRNHD